MGTVKIGTAPVLRDGQSLQDWCDEIETENRRLQNNGESGVRLDDVIRVLCVRIDEIERKMAAAIGSDGRGAR